MQARPLRSLLSAPLPRSLLQAGLLQTGLLQAGLVLALAAASPGCSDIRDCESVDISGAQALPSLLSETGLYQDIAASVVADGVLEFSPQYPLWTDTAAKRRWLLLPEGGQVDTRDADNWVFPVGTRTFKEFERDGVRVETRMNLKTESGWAAAAYIWNEAGDDALIQLTTAENVSGTQHDVPGAAECLACHGGRADFTLGFSATQLGPDVRAALFDQSLLSDPVPGTLQLEPAEEAALGYLHGNCSHCHNADRNDQAQATECYTLEDNFDLSLPHDLSTVDDAPALLTARWQVGGGLESDILDRMSRRDTDPQEPSMPPLGTELVDSEGLALVEAWISQLPEVGGGGGRR